MTPLGSSPLADLFEPRPTLPRPLSIRIAKCHSCSESPKPLPWGVCEPLWKEAEKSAHLSRERSLPPFVKRAIRWCNKNKKRLASIKFTQSDFVLLAAAQVAADFEVIRPSLWKDREFILSMCAALKD